MEERGKVVSIGALELRFLVDDTESAGSVVMFEFTVPPNARVPAPHFHRDVDEVMHGLEGTLTVRLDDQKHELRKGDTLFLPRGRVHHHENLHPEPSRTLVILTPGLIGRRYFDEIAQEINVQA